MAIKKVMLNEEEIFIDDEVDSKETGIVINNENLEKTVVVNPIDEEELNDKTSLDIFGGDNE